jgi:hypothetical protein
MNVSSAAATAWLPTVGPARPFLELDIEVLNGPPSQGSTIDLL